MRPYFMPAPVGEINPEKTRKKTPWIILRKPLECRPMKNDSLARMLMGVLAASAVASVILFVLFYLNQRSLRSLQGQAYFINNRKALVGALIGDCVEYSKQNPAIDPILEGIGAKPPKNPPAAAKPATK
jgi:hypothetical protein